MNRCSLLLRGLGALSFGLLITLGLGMSLGTRPAWAGPGAHGPNGEHLDVAPGAAAVAGAGSAPRLEAQSELFELVGRLGGAELSLLIDRFDTNEPVLQARVEVASGPLKATAKFHADIGDYAVDDAAMLQHLSQPGEHPIVITVLAGDDSDLLDAVLRVGMPPSATASAHDPHHDHDHGTAHTHSGVLWRWAAGGLGVLMLLVAGGIWRRRVRAQNRAIPATPA